MSELDDVESATDDVLVTLVRAARQKASVLDAVNQARRQLRLPDADPSAAVALAQLCVVMRQRPRDAEWVLVESSITELATDWLDRHTAPTWRASR